MLAKGRFLAAVSHGSAPHERHARPAGVAGSDRAFAEQVSVLGARQAGGQRVAGAAPTTYSTSSRNVRRCQLPALPCSPTDLVELCATRGGGALEARSRHLQLRPNSWIRRRPPLGWELDPHRCSRCCTTCSPTPSGSASRGEMGALGSPAGAWDLGGVDDQGPASAPSCCPAVPAPSRGGAGTIRARARARARHLSPVMEQMGGEIRSSLGGRRRQPLHLCLALRQVQEKAPWQPRVGGCPCNCPEEQAYLRPWLAELGLPRMGWPRPRRPGG